MVIVVLMILVFGACTVAGYLKSRADYAHLAGESTSPNPVPRRTG